MLRSLWLLGLYFSFIGIGLAAPFVTTLGYVWVDTFQPQYVAYLLLNQFPVSMVMGAAAFVTYLMMDRRSPPPLFPETALQLVFALWASITMIWAAAPEMAWLKWDWASKVLLFTAFVPYVIRSRVQIEALIYTYVFALAANFVPFGLKTLISGGGYGVNLGLQTGNGGMAEGGHLSTVCLMSVPLALFLGHYGQLLPRVRFLPLAFWGLAGLAIATAVGTHERSALIGLLVLLAIMVAQSKHKVAYSIGAAVVLAGLLLATSAAWNDRISTIQNYSTEGSAFVRLQVWRWTWDYVAQNPLGGGFMVYVINSIQLPGLNGGAPEIQFGRAFHSIYFEILGEQGYPGMGLFLLITAFAVYRLRRTAKRAKLYPELEWVGGLSRALQAGMAVFLTAGAFVGLAYQPMYWYFIAMGVSLNAYMWRVERNMATQTSGWRAVAAVPASDGWRNRPMPPAVGTLSRTR